MFRQGKGYPSEAVLHLVVKPQKQFFQNQGKKIFLFDIE